MDDIRTTIEISNSHYKIKELGEKVLDGVRTFIERLIKDNDFGGMFVLSDLDKNEVNFSFIDIHFSIRILHDLQKGYIQWNIFDENNSNGSVTQVKLDSFDGLGNVFRKGDSIVSTLAEDYTKQFLPTLNLIVNEYCTKKNKLVWVKYDYDWK
jgi:hypothetical protein